MADNDLGGEASIPEPHNVGFQIVVASPLLIERLGSTGILKSSEV